MVEWSIDALAQAASVAELIVAVPPGEEDALGTEDRVTVLAGGGTRAESVANALAATDAELVLIHDAARPLVTAELVDRVVERLSGDETLAGAIAVEPVTDTTKRVDAAGSEVVETIDRDSLRAAQTPQAFRASALREALAAPGASRATDEAMLVEAAGGRVAVVEAGAPNPKVTGPEDLEVVEALLAARSARPPRR